MVLEASRFELAGADPGKDLVPFELALRCDAFGGKNARPLQVGLRLVQCCSCTLDRLSCAQLSRFGGAQTLF